MAMYSANLEKGRIRSTREAREKGRLGGLASGRTRREQKTIRELVNTIFAVPLKAGEKPLKLKNIKSLVDLENGNLTTAIAGIAKLAQMVAHGDLNAIKLWFEISGEAKQNLNLMGNIDVTAKHDLSSLTNEELATLAELVAKTTETG